MAKYRVKPGFRHGAGKRFGPGEIVELSPQDAEGFLDKLELVPETEVVIDVSTFDNPDQFLTVPAHSLTPVLPEPLPENKGKSTNPDPVRPSKRKKRV